METTGAICDKKVPAKFKVKIYQTVIKSTMCYGTNMAIEKERGTSIKDSEMRMLR